jgi:hypothetical protein
MFTFPLKLPMPSGIEQGITDYLYVAKWSNEFCAINFYLWLKSYEWFLLNRSIFMNEKLIYSLGRVPVEMNDVSAQWSSQKVLDFTWCCNFSSLYSLWFLVQYQKHNIRVVKLCSALQNIFLCQWFSRQNCITFYSKLHLIFKGTKKKNNLHTCLP